MRAAPVHQETIHLRRSAFQGFKVWAGIDRGCSLTKVAFVPKDSSSSSDSASSDSDSVVPVRCLTFLNDDFEDALHTMKEHAQLPDTGELHVTGVGCDAYKDKIKEIIGLDIVFISEFVTVGRGIYILLNFTPDPNDIFLPKPDHKRYKLIRTEQMTESFDAFLKMLEERGDGLLPGLILDIGFGGRVTILSEDGASKLCKVLSMSDLTFFGLTNALLGTNDYDEVMEMASRGDQISVDLRIKDILDNVEGTPYAFLPKDMPLMSFGKAASNDWSRDKCSKEDIAHAMLAFFLGEVTDTAFSNIGKNSASKIYITGDFFRAHAAQKMIHEKLMAFLSDTKLDVNTIKTVHLAPIGAMLTHKEDEQKFISE